jgi:hypothetical protein
MIGASATFTGNPQAVVKAVDKAAYRSLSHAAASIRRDAIASLQRARGPSAVGSPPHTRGRFPRAIAYDANKESAVIGPRYSRFGTAAQAHEHEGMRVYRGQRFGPRQTMFPAMTRNLSRFAASWRGEVHS